MEFDILELIKILLEKLETLIFTDIPDQYKFVGWAEIHFMADLQISSNDFYILGKI